MKINFWTSLSVLLIAVNILLIYHKYTSSKKFEELNSMYQGVIDRHKTEKEVDVWYNLMPFYANGTYLNDTLGLKTIESEIHPLENLYSEDGVWVFRYFNKTCLSCVEESVGLIRDAFNNNPQLPFVVMTNFLYANEMKLFLTKTHFSCKIYSVGTLLNFPPEEAGIPYLAFIDKSGMVTNSIVIQKEQTNLLRQLLILIVNRNEISQN